VLLVGHVQHQFDVAAQTNSLPAKAKLVLDAPSYRQSGSDRLAGGPF
jgi:hypothetical protein